MSDSAVSLIELSRVAMQRGDEDKARRNLDRALELAAEAGAPQEQIRGGAFRARLTGEGLEEVRAQIGEGMGALPVNEQLQVRWALWEATQDEAERDEARRLVNHLVAHAPSDVRSKMTERLSLYRQVLGTS